MLELNFLQGESSQKCPCFKGQHVHAKRT
jgi:hypothetical protein